MSKANHISKECFWAILCISVILLNGCQYLELKKAKPDDTNIEDEELEPLKKIKILKTKLKALKNEMSIQIETSDKKLSDLQTAKEDVEKDFADTKERLENENKDLSDKIKAFGFELSDTETRAVATGQGSGYLSKGPALGLGMIDGDDEVNVLKKIRILKTRVKTLKNEMSIQIETSNKKLSDLQAAKEGVEKDFADTKERLENENKDLSDKIKAFESELSDTEARAVAAEKELNPVKEELLKTQLSEIKAQQELYKLKIDNLKQEEE